MNKLQAQGIENQMKQRIEEVQLNMDSEELQKMGIENNLDEQTQKIEDMKKFTDKLAVYLVDQVDTLDDRSELKTLDQITELYTTQRSKLLGLQKQEEEYNKNVQVVVESDEQQVKLNEAIAQLKKEIEGISAKLEKASTDFKEVSSSRKTAFLTFFDETATQVQKVYQKMSGEEGTATLTLFNRDTPFQSEEE